LNLQGIQKIVLALILSPVVALITGGLVMVLLLWLFGRNSPRVLNSQFRKMQLLSASLMSFSHGSNDAQKSMGIITLALLSASQITSLEVPNWVKLACSLAMACGTAAGGWKIIKTMGTRIFPMEPINGFAADINSSMIILMATFFHLPVSTTHVVSGSIMGVGSAKRVTAVRWGVAQQMGYAWVMTIPSSAAVSGLIYCLFTLVPR
jgi:PiT family inorganic phosphate transporter